MVGGGTKYYFFIPYFFILLYRVTRLIPSARAVFVRLLLFLNSACSINVAPYRNHAKRKRIASA